MSNPLAIATVTATLRNLLEQVSGVQPDVVITTQPPDKARQSHDGSNQINLFLYQIALNAAWQKKASSLQSGSPPLALNLYYLLTAYGKNDQDLLSHRLLGQAMSLLQGHPVLQTTELQAALVGNDLHAQEESVRITPHPLSLEDLSKLCNIFQGPYGISVAYQVAVVLMTEQASLIRGDRPSPPPPPSPTAKPLPRYPTLTQVRLPSGQLSVRPGDCLQLQGYHLAADQVRVRFCSQVDRDGIAVASPLTGDAASLRVALPPRPDTADYWPSGLMTIAVEVQQVGQPVQITNVLPLTLAPTLLHLTPAIAPGDQPLTLTVTCRPPVWPQQTAVLRLGRHTLTAAPRSHPSDRLTFSGPSLPVGTYPAHLRVDGIEDGTAVTAVPALQVVPSQEVTAP